MLVRIGTPRLQPVDPVERLRQREMARMRRVAQRIHDPDIEARQRRRRCHPACRPGRPNTRCRRTESPSDGMSPWSLQDRQGGDRRRRRPSIVTGSPGADPVLGQDRRILAAGRRHEAIAEARMHRRAMSARRDRHRCRRRCLMKSPRRSSMPWVWSACSWVNKHAVELRDVGVQKLLAQVRRGIDQHAGFCLRRRSARPGSSSAAGGSSDCPDRRRPSPARAAARRPTSRSQGW